MIKQIVNPYKGRIDLLGTDETRILHRLLTREQKDQITSSIQT